MGPYIAIAILALFSLYQYFVILSLTASINSLKPWVHAVTEFVTLVDKEISELQVKNK